MDQTSLFPDLHFKSNLPGRNVYVRLCRVNRSSSSAYWVRVSNTRVNFLKKKIGSSGNIALQISGFLKTVFHTLNDEWDASKLSICLWGVSPLILHN